MKTNTTKDRNLTKEELLEAADWRRELNPKTWKSDWKPDWCRNGVEALIESARDYYSKTGHVLPYNLATHGPWVGYPSGHHRLFEGDRYGSPSKEKMVEFAGRVAGWIRTVANFCPGIVWLLRNTCSSRGMGSPYTICSPYGLFRSFPSPHRAERKFRMVRQRANQILEPYGLRVSWRGMVKAMTGSRKATGKMAFVAAAETINNYLSDYQGFTGSPVEILIKARGVYFLKQYENRADRHCYASWAVARVEAGEFSCLGEAFVAMEDRLVEWDEHNVVDIGIARCHADGRMVEIPLAFNNGQSVFIRGKEVVFSHYPEQAWASFQAADLCRRKYAATVCPQDFLYLLTVGEKNIYKLVYEAVKKWLRINFAGLPIKCFKGFRIGLVDFIIQQWAFDRIMSGEFRSFNEAIASSDRLVFDNTDRVELLLDPATTQVIHRVECTIGWGANKTSQFILRQGGTNRTFHVQIGWSQKADDPRSAVKKAIAAWHKQVVLERKEADLVAFLRGDRGFCPLIYRQESYRAGNCQSGTEAWVVRNGWSNRRFIPAEWLIPHLGETRVRNVAMVLYQDLTKI